MYASRSARLFALFLVGILLWGCSASNPQREPAGSLARFVPLASDPRVLYEAGAEAYAARVAEHLPRAMAQVERGHYRAFARPVQVYVCGSERCFTERVPDPPDVTAAVIRGNRLLLAPRLFDREPHRLYPILVHELSHLHLGQQLGHYAPALPIWFHEGLASLVAEGGGADLAGVAEVARSIETGRYLLPSAEHNEHRRQPAHRWGIPTRVFYRQSMMLVEHLRAADEPRFREFLETLQDGGDFNLAFAQAFGKSPRRVARGYFEGLRRRG